MQQCLPFLSAHLCICIAENKADSGEEIALARAITPNDNVVLRGERFDDSLLLVAVKLLAGRSATISG